MIETLNPFCQESDIEDIVLTIISNLMTFLPFLDKSTLRNLMRATLADDILSTFDLAHRA